MKKLILFFTLNVFFQNLSQATISNNNGRLYGKIIDSKTKQPVEYASVALFALTKDSLISGGLTKENGDFTLENLPSGTFRLKVDFIGYKLFETKVTIAPPDKLNNDLGDLSLEQDEKLLKEVEVTAEKSTFIMSVDRKVYNVDKDLSVKGGTGLDVMKNIPTLTVDGEGKVTLRESGVQIYIDGRPTTLSLQQIPADQIDRVEVISNPSVKFDASTTGGIINIVFKKNTKPGYNGMIMGNIGTGDRYGGMGSLSLKQNPFNVSLFYSINSALNDNNGFTKTTYLSNNVPIEYFNQENISHASSIFQIGRLSADYFINNRNTLTLSGNFVAGNFGSSDVQDFEILSGDKQFVIGGYKINDSKSAFKNYTSQVLYRKIYPKAGKELTIDINHNYSKSANNYTFHTRNKDINDNDLPLSPEIQKNTGGGNSNQFVFQLDFVNPNTEKSKIEIGIRSYYKNWLRFNNTTNYSYATNTFEKDTFMSNNYVVDDMVNAAYINYSNYMFWDIGYQVGLRFEQTFFKGKLTDKDQSFQYIYPGDLNTIQNSLFPAIYLSKKLKAKHEVQFNISRKITRPDFFQTLPYVMFADKRNIRTGNPQLKPEFVNISEINYNNLFKKGNWLTSLYGRYSEQPITNAAYPSAIDTSILINTFVNGKSSFRYGLENTLRYTFFKKLTATANFDVFYVLLTGDILNNQQPNITQGWSYKGKLNLSYNLPWQLTLQVNGNYEAPRIILNGKTLPVYFFDVSLNKMLAYKWMFNLTLSDVLNSKRMGTDLYTDYYIQSLSRRRETRYLKFSISYMFGKSTSNSKQRNQKRENQNMSSDGLDF